MWVQVYIGLWDLSVVFFVGREYFFALWNREMGWMQRPKRKHRVHPLLKLTSPPMGPTTLLGPIHAFRDQYHVQRGGGGAEYGNIKKRRDLDDAVVRWPSAVVISDTEGAHQDNTVL